MKARIYISYFGKLDGWKDIDIDENNILKSLRKFVDRDLYIYDCDSGGDDTYQCVLKYNDNIKYYELTHNYGWSWDYANNERDLYNYYSFDEKTKDGLNFNYPKDVSRDYLKIPYQTKWPNIKV